MSGGKTFAARRAARSARDALVHLSVDLSGGWDRPPGVESIPEVRGGRGWSFRSPARVDASRLSSIRTLEPRAGSRSPRAVHLRPIGDDRPRRRPRSALSRRRRRGSAVEDRRPRLAAAAAGGGRPPRPHRRSRRGAAHFAVLAGAARLRRRRRRAAVAGDEPRLADAAAARSGDRQFGLAAALRQSAGDRAAAV